MTLPASQAILDLPAGTTLVGTELLEAVQTGTGGFARSVQITATQFAALATGGSTAACHGAGTCGGSSSIPVSLMPSTMVIAPASISLLISFAHGRVSLKSSPPTRSRELSQQARSVTGLHPSA